MDWNNIFVILLWMWVVRFILGAAYGIYLMRKSHPNTWIFQDQIIAGLPFWIGWYIGTGTRRLVRWQKDRKHTQ